jgi:4-hydroxy-tetrahydrodipicolinate reductase
MRTADQPIRISLVAPNGRMGKAIAAAVREDAAFAIDDEHADVFLDFSAPAALAVSLGRARSAAIPILVGTTGLGEEHQALIEDAAKSVAVLRAPNTSVGINLLRWLVEQATARLGPEWDIEILEMHHRAKVDAPSGTALLLGRAAAQGRGIDLDARGVKSREGHTGARKSGDIGFATLRGGTVVGEHSAIFAGTAERIELTHRAEDRMIFARGALKAALWIRGKEPGLYNMLDVLGLRD